jgi:hypothetical protein
MEVQEHRCLASTQLVMNWLNHITQSVLELLFMLPHYASVKFSEFNFQIYSLSPQGVDRSKLQQIFPLPAN